MNTNKKAIVSITEMGNKFSEVSKLVDRYGSAVVLKNGLPRYLITEFQETETLQTAPAEDTAKISEKLIKRNIEVYKELAK